jgi:hypothetical protein
MVIFVFGLNSRPLNHLGGILAISSPLGADLVVSWSHLPFQPLRGGFGISPFSCTNARIRTSRDIPESSRVCSASNG